MNLLGLILAKILEKNILSPAKAGLAGRLNSSINIKAGKMRANLSFMDGSIIIKRGFDDNANAYVSGTMRAFLNLGLRKNIAPTFLNGEIKIGGNILKLIPLMKLMSI